MGRLVYLPSSRGSLPRLSVHVLQLSKVRCRFLTCHGVFAQGTLQPRVNLDTPFGYLFSPAFAIELTQLVAETGPRPFERIGEREAADRRSLRVRFRPFCIFVVASALLPILKLRLVAELLLRDLTTLALCD